MKFFVALIVALIVILIAAISECHAAEFHFAWDYGNEPDIDGFRLYSGHVVQQDSDNWAVEFDSTPLVDGIPSDVRNWVANVPGLPNVSRKFCFYLRAYRGDRESLDSNHVCAIIDNTVDDTVIPAPTNFRFDD